ncbi:GumC family protein [uncultured Sphingomonas sp.]|uniref:GumC family protein n=1 Tax=uncultured Sphingomonas sp. TaxID=158754 RepID=UPI0035CBC579
MTPITADDAFYVAPSAAGRRSAADQKEVKGFDLREIWALIYRSRYWIGAIFAVAVAGAILFTLLATPYYASSASIEVRQEAEKVLGTEADRESASSRMDAERFLQTQLDIIRSRAVATVVAENLGLFRGDGFLEAMKVNDTKTGRILSEREAHRDQVLKVLHDNLSVEYTGDTRIAVLTFTSPDARLAARVANGFADSYIRNSLERRASSSTYALDFLRRQLAEAQVRLQQSERDAIGYARQTRIVDASNAASGGSEQTQPQSLITAQLVQLNTAFAGATAQRIDAEQKWRTIAVLPLLQIPEVLSNQAVQELVQRRAQLQANYREQLASRQEDYPSVRQLAAQVKEISGQIDTLARSIRGSIQSQYDVAAAREREISSKLDALKSSTLFEQNQTIQLSILRRGADTNRQQYDALLKRYNSLNAESGVQTNNLTIVDRAEVMEKPSWPKLPISVGVALALALLASTAFVVGRAQIFDSIRTPHDVSDRMGMALLGVVPTTEDITQSLLDIKSPINEAISSISASLSLASANGTPRTIMFTSAQAAEGKSNTCYALARSFARLGKSVIIVDMDLRRPNAHKLLSLKNDLGVTSVLTGQTSLDQAIQPTDLPQLTLLSSGPVPPNPSEFVAGTGVNDLLNILMSRFDVVMVDSAPVLGLADAVLLSAQVVATVFVIESGRNSVRGAQHSIRRLTDAGGNVLGAILTKFDAVKLGYGAQSDYGYNYGYHYSSRSA